MKTLFNSLALLMVLLSSCIPEREETSSFPYDHQYLQAEARQINAEQGLTPDSILYSFHGHGKLTARELEEVYEGEKYRYLSLEYTGERGDKTPTTLYFDMGLSVGEIPFPDFIANASVTHFRGQLLVRDLDSDFAINLWAPTVDEDVNRFPKVTTKQVSSFRVRTPDSH